jgi:hypothetical protein
VTDQPGGPLGPGVRGLRPGLGDLVHVDGQLVSGLRGWHWMRVLRIADPYAVPLLLAGYLLPRDDLGETTTSPVYEVAVCDPAALVVLRAVDPPPVAPRAVAGRVPGLVEQLLAPAVGQRTDLPAAVADALARPDHHRRGETGVWRWPE